jgi:hypothetical protein
MDIDFEKTKKRPANVYGGFIVSGGGGGGSGILSISLSFENIMEKRVITSANNKNRPIHGSGGLLSFGSFLQIKKVVVAITKMPILININRALE